MPIHIVLTSPAELISAAVVEARNLSDKILKLSDLDASPLAPGETPDSRRHQIAKLGKTLAETFVIFDRLMLEIGDAHMKAHDSDVTAGPVAKPDNPDAN